MKEIVFLSVCMVGVEKHSLVLWLFPKEQGQGTLSWNVEKVFVLVVCIV